MISIRKKNNNRNQYKWGKHTYWLYLMENGKAIANTHINANSELDKKLIQELFYVVKDKYKSIERLKITLDLLQSEIRTFYESKISFEIVEDNEELKAIIKHAKGEEKWKETWL